MARDIEKTATASRRAVLGAAGGVLLAGASLGTGAMAGEPDAELIRLCEEFDGLSLKYHALFDGPTAILNDNERLPFAEEIETLQQPLFNRIMDIRATSLQGLMARARMYYRANPHMRKPDAYSSLDWDQWMLVAIARDLAGESGS